MAQRPLVDGLAQVIVGDSTSHGGTVLSGSPTTFFGPGKIPIARVGDMTFCPRCEPHVFPIAQGHSYFFDNHMAVALHGHKTACGASLIAVAGGSQISPPAGEFGSDYTLEPDDKKDMNVEMIDADGNAPKSGESLKIKFHNDEKSVSLDGAGKGKVANAQYGVMNSTQPKRSQS